MALDTCPWDPSDPECDPYVELVKLCQRNVRADADNCGVIDGYEGSGKSECGMRLAADVSSDRPEPDRFQPARDLILTFRHWYSQYDLGAQGRTYLFDEGGNLGLGQDSSKTENKLQTKIAMQSRVLNSTTIWVVPNKHWMTPYLRLHRFQWWVHVERRNEVRGFATLLWKEYDWRKNEARWEDAGEFRFPQIPKGHPFMNGYRNRKLEALREVSEEQDRPERGERKRSHRIGRPPKNGSPSSESPPPSSGQSLS